MCIVVVDVEPTIRQFVSEALEDEGYPVRAFSHPLPVADLPDDDGLPSVFLIDIQLPDMDSIALAQRLTETGFPTTPKIAMSASPDAIHQAQQSHLFNAAIAKPFEIDYLLDCVDSQAHS